MVFGSSLPSSTKKNIWTPLTKFSGSAHDKGHVRCDMDPYHTPLDLAILIDMPLPMRSTDRCMELFPVLQM